jgi:4-amino-4-deoxy-L-arabinose transferase-like glycosyltransferase
MVVYRESTQFFSGGINEILRAGVTIHPPLIYVINFLAFSTIGKNPTAYNLAGTVIFFVSSIFLYFFVKNLFGIKTAIPLVILLFLNPFVILNSFYLMNDMLILAGTIFAIGFYINNRKMLFSVTLALMVLMKETALALILSFSLIVCFEIFVMTKHTGNRVKELVRGSLLFLPSILVFLAWTYFLKSLGTTEWRDPVFNPNNTSSYLIVLDNFLKLKVLNVFLLENLSNVFILNFHWIYLLGLLVLSLLFRREIFAFTKKQEYFCIALVTISLCYIVLVFSFPTWTIPRYILPILFPFFFFLAFFIAKVRNFKVYTLVVGAFFLFTLLTNVYSLDPLTLHLGRTEMINQTFYDNSLSVGGPDKLIYNTQFLSLTEYQNNMIRDAIDTNMSYFPGYCDELKVGEKINYSLTSYNEFYPQLILKKKIRCLDID